ncbi:MAG: amino acid permease [Asticcacaulis sp.]|nr:amino acid permease [Asticcacaulis sp.]
MPARLFARKSIEALQAEEHPLHRTLDGFQLMLLGIGCIVGAGVYVMTGTAAAHFAGPAVILSFLLAATACGFTALCYAELASTIPVSGSSYTYAYATLGQVVAWGLSWLLMLEYGLAGSALAVGFSSYLVSLLTDFGVNIPAWLSTPSVVSTVVDGRTSFSLSGGVNLIAAIALLISAVILSAGVSKSTLVTTILVFIKISVLIAFVAVGTGAVNPANWTPFIPANEGGFAFGWQGIVRGASILFFAYLGFETVSTAASETKNPQRNMPIGILGALFVCTALYIAVAAVLTGLVPYKELGVADPIAVAVDRIGQPAFAFIIKIGALTGLASVLLVNGYGHSRICYAMGRDGLIPPLFSKVHPRLRTPVWGTITVCLTSAVIAAFLPISVLGDMVSFGTALAFSIVAFSLIWLRNRRPDLPRPFRVPLGGFSIGKVWIGYVPLLAIVLCFGMVIPVGMDILSQAGRGDVLPAIFLGLYLLAGVLIYVFYGYRNAHTPDTE